MSHRKFERPRHGSMAYSPRKRASSWIGRIKSFPPDDPTQKPHLTAFIGFKAGMTHIVHEMDRPGSRTHKKEVVAPVTIIEVPPMVIVGMVGYANTTHGLRTLKTVWTQHLSDDVRRRMYRNWYKAKRVAFRTYVKKYENGAVEIARDLACIKQECEVVRALVHTQPRKIQSLKTKRAQLIEIQVNGGTMEEKVNWIHEHFEKAVDIKSVFTSDEVIDTISVTKGHGFEGVTHRWGTKKLPRKTHRGRRKVACIGAWHPSRVMHTVPRSGQCGFHHRTERNKRIYRIGNGSDPSSATTEFDITVKSITPMGAFPHYGIVTNDFLMLKGSCPGPKKRPIALRKTLRPTTSRSLLEKMTIKFIDTAAKYGHGRFQTPEEKQQFYGPRKNQNIGA